ncbi:hypothetical protein LOK49_LG04G00429 [Camellia lanceoleosa]|uniref:Uncharacterized protein n=1 Tax=Camellia lanceoleosa TaxID=1840588 RepID=A0ACC0HZ19_9ERIC|nr:hypothetical protein LOK49_LG04G00429 [Camellia lanceoleosa]
MRSVQQWVDREHAADVQSGIHGTRISSAMSPENHRKASTTKQLILRPVSSSATTIALLKYCQALLKSLKTGRAQEVDTWRQLVSSLEERIRTHQQDQVDPLKEATSSNATRQSVDLEWGIRFGHFSFGSLLQKAWG